MAKRRFGGASFGLVAAFAVCGACLGAVPAALAGDPCTSAVEAATARDALIDLLEIERGGARLDALLGWPTDRDYYARVDLGDAQEPGWDVVEIRPQYEIASGQCHAEQGVAVHSFEVSFTAGWWFSRSEYGPQDPGTASYRIAIREGKSYLLAPLAPPVLSPEGAAAMLGKKPYHDPRLRGLVEALKRAP